MINALLMALRRFGATTSIVVMSQAISAFSLLLLPLLGLGVSDVYAFAIQIAAGPYNGLVMGVIYLLVIGRPHFSAWARMRFTAAAFSLLLTAGALVYVGSQSNIYKLPHESVIAITTACGLSGTGLAIAAIRGVQEACNGRPALLAGITIISNLAMGATTLTVTFFAQHSMIGVVFPAFAGMVANFALAIWSVVAPMTTGTAMASPNVGNERRINLGIQTFGLVLGVISSTIFPVGFVAAANKLSTGAATILFLASRVGSAVIGILINSVLLVQSNWQSQELLLGSFSTQMTIFATASAGIAILLHGAGVGSTASYVVVLIAWLSSLSATPAISREVNRRRLGKTIAVKSAVDVAASGLALAWLLIHPSVTGYFGVYMLSQGTTCLIFGMAIFERNLAAASGLLVVLSCVLLLWGW